MSDLQRPSAMALFEWLANRREAAGKGKPEPFEEPALMLWELEDPERFRRLVDKWLELNWFYPDAPFEELRLKALIRPDDRRRWYPPHEFLELMKPYRREDFLKHCARYARWRPSAEDRERSRCVERTPAEAQAWLGSGIDRALERLDPAGLREFAISELGEEARSMTTRAMMLRLYEKSRREAWWRLIGPKAQPAAELQGTARVNEMPVDGGGEIAW